jgi:glyoxylase-like metal-dependent hydrolase (beta-lactamase superfamily II)
LVNAIDHAWSFGFEMDQVIEPVDYVEEGDEIAFGKSHLKVIYTPGHADGSICLLCEEGEFVISGDVLFQGSIGRTDLPTGDFNVLLGNITNKLLTLPSHYTVYPGHGPSTTIGAEVLYNPYLDGSDL